MSNETRVNRAGRPASSRLIRVVAISLTVAAVGYGIAETAANFLQARAGTEVPVAAASGIAGPELQPAAVEVPVAIRELAPAVVAGDQVAGPRACDLEQGITEDCIFD